MVVFPLCSSNCPQPKTGLRPTHASRAECSGPIRAPSRPRCFSLSCAGPVVRAMATCRTSGSAPQALRAGAVVASHVISEPASPVPVARTVGVQAWRPQVVRPPTVVRPGAPALRAPVAPVAGGSVWPGNKLCMMPPPARAAAVPRLVIVPPASQAAVLPKSTRCAAGPASASPRPMPAGVRCLRGGALTTPDPKAVPRTSVVCPPLTVVMLPCEHPQASCALELCLKRPDEAAEMPPGVPKRPRTHRRSRASVGNQFASQAALERALRDREVDEFLDIMPEAVSAELLGGRHGFEQVNDPQVRARALRRAVELKAGTDGGSLQAAARAWRGFCSYVELKQLPNGGLPASPILIAAYLEWEASNASGSAGGSSVANSRRVGLLWLSEKLSFPLEVSSPVVLASANPAQIREWRREDPEGRQRKTAGSLPIGLYCHFEYLAKAKAPSPVREFARSMVAFSHMMSIRAKDMLRTVPCKDSLDHANVITGWSYVSKDGEPLQTFAPAEGFLGPFTWWKEHHKLVSKWGKPLVQYKIMYGGHNSILHAESDEPMRTASHWPPSSSSARTGA